jgi:acyl-homoserine-lactone acylase
VPLDASDPVNTPNGLTPAATSAMLRILQETVQKLQRLNIPLDARLGDYQGHTINRVRVPIHGAIGDIDGSYNSIHMSGPLDEKGYHDVAWGTSYVQTVTFDETGPVAQALLLYGQSVDPKSPWYADQLGLYSKKQWPVLPFTAERIKADPNYMMTTLAE